MFSSDVFVIQTFGFFGAISEHALALVAKRKVDGSGNLLADSGVRFNLLADGLNCGVGAQKTIGQRLVLTQQAEQQMLGLDVGTSKLAGFVSCEENDSPRLLRITFKHSYRRLSTLSVVPGAGDRVENHRPTRGSKALYPTAESGRI